jgi:signal transduction histidine kinase
VPTNAAGPDAGDEARVAAARLEALREFAYGAGHEINNPLANIAARAQALLIDEVDPERRRRLATIVDQAFRARDMIGGLMIFARPPRPAPERVGVDQLLRRAIDAVRPVAEARGVRLEYAPAPRPVDVFFDPAHGTEVVRLLVMNAVEAVEPGGRVTLGVVAQDRDGRPAAVVSIGDDGRGMDAAMLRRAFDPFTSGREAGRGIGMGLPKAWRLLEIGGGTLAVDTAPGRGTRVDVVLPVPAA